MTVPFHTFATTGRRVLSALTLSIACAVLTVPRAGAEASGPDYLKVSGVARDDTLNIRSGPGTGNRVVAVAPNGAVFRNLGCRDRWCHVETPDGRVNGWAAQSYLSEAAAPSHHTADAAPELHVRGSGEYEVRFAAGCTVLFNGGGHRINAGGSCYRDQLSRAQDAVDRYRREQGTGTANTEGGGAGGNVNLRGVGVIYGGGQTSGQVIGHREGHYAVIITAPKEGLTCTAKVDHAPGTVRSEALSIHCSNGVSGFGSLTQNRGGNHYTLAFTLTDGSGGYVLF
ncbi:SH3 domain-containing protein [Pseudooceanicola sp. LIPI14-2-Ac024]|uniref:SH3 domain-containing protein n=1 Tax=Pseudooceanicola sp. LIPI14-2-Ac024 TaxID=3344875 RepID=UPI0035D01BBA